VLASKSSNSIGLIRGKKKPRASTARGYRLLPQPEALFDLDDVFSGGAGHTVRIGASARDNVQADAAFHCGVALPKKKRPRRAAQGLSSYWNRTRHFGEGVRGAGPISHQQPGQILRPPLVRVLALHSLQCSLATIAGTKSRIFA
jgi:hypothetical protein